MEKTSRQTLGVQECKKFVQDRDRWKDVVMAVKTNRVINTSEEEKVFS